MKKADSVREEALKILVKVFQEGSYSNILIKNIGQKYTPLDRAFITELVYGTIKYSLKIDYCIEQFSKLKLRKISPYILNILRLGIYQISFMDRVPQSAAVNECVKLAKMYGNPGSVKYVNGMLRNYCRNYEDIKYPERGKDIVQYLSVRYSYPEWIVNTILNQYDNDFTEDFLSASNNAPPVTIRVNTLKTDRDSLRSRLSEKGIDVSDGLYLDNALILKNVPGIENMDEYREGLFTVQDESSMIVSRVLSPEPGDFVMDLCSAPGTKSTNMAEIMGNRGKILSGDVNNSKLKLVEKNAARLGIDIISTVCADASKVMEEYAGKADRVLLDVPCSGLGILRKKPEIRWNRQIKDLQEICRMQRSILNASSAYVKPGGVLVYSTCTVTADENINMVLDFVDKNKDFYMDDITCLMPEKLKKETAKKGYVNLFPNTDAVDGFFICRMRKVI